MNTFLKLSGMTMLGGAIGTVFSGLLIIVFRLMFGTPTQGGDWGSIFMLIVIVLFALMGLLSGVDELAEHNGH